jgi:transcriptional regulator with XRE-family HTH domain
MVQKSASPIDRHVGARVRMLRMMAHMTQEKLGEALGITFQQVQKYEKGANRISASKLQQISSILNVSVSFFFEGIPMPEQSPLPADVPSATEINEFLTSREGLALTRAFVRIEDPKLRRRIVDLIEQIQETHQDTP